MHRMHRECFTRANYEFLRVAVEGELVNSAANGRESEINAYSCRCRRAVRIILSIIRVVLRNLRWFWKFSIRDARDLMSEYLLFRENV